MIRYDNAKSKSKKIITLLSFNAPKYFKIIFTLFIVSVFVHIISLSSQSFSDFITENIASVPRTVIAAITGWIPFSVAETFILMLPVLIIVYLALTNYYFIKMNNSIKPLFFGVAALLMSMYSVAVFTFFTSYTNSTIDKKLGMTAAPVSAVQLKNTADEVYRNINILSESVEYSYEGFSSMPYSIDNMSQKLVSSYKKLNEEHKFLHNVPAKIKPIALSKLMSYTHITGVYTFFTGEANIDAEFPDFTLPYTAAHEFAHQRGIARENEANFIAFLVCIKSDDPYIQYSGYMNILQYLLSALYRADRELYSEFYSNINSKVTAELRAYSSFFDQYRDSTASKISGAVNDTYLKLQGTEGSVSYGMVVDLAVAYYQATDDEN